jgi:hypothetical protein
MFSPKVGHRDKGVYAHHQGQSCSHQCRTVQVYKFYRYPVSGPGSSVGIATHYGLDGPGIESRWR